MSKEQDDVVARSVAETKLADLLATTPDGPAGDGGLSVRESLEKLAESVRFETVVSKVKGGEVPLRRLHMVGPWEVDPGRVGQ